MIRHWVCVCLPTVRRWRKKDTLKNEMWCLVIKGRSLIGSVNNMRTREPINWQLGWIFSSPRPWGGRIRQCTSYSYNELQRVEEGEREIVSVGKERSSSRGNIIIFIWVLLPFFCGTVTHSSTVLRYWLKGTNKEDEAGRKFSPYPQPASNNTRERRWLRKEGKAVVGGGGKGGGVSFSW